MRRTKIGSNVFRRWLGVKSIEGMHDFKPQLLGKSPVRKVILEKVLTHVILSNSEEGKHTERKQKCY